MRGGPVEQKSAVTEIDCYRVLRELSDYLEADLPPQLRLEIEKHLKECDHCKAVHDGLRNVVRLLGDEKVIELPKGFGERLYQSILSAASAGADTTIQP
ncbi:MAG: anti-sigma factor family protein [Terriglobales bacterium]|jgi:anti-sigma factor RsiW|nr:zf-HC2 domain-containing protein [Terriglobales bacterium]